MLGRITLAIAIALLVAAPAQAKQVAFTAALRGDTIATMTGSTATGAARVLVDLDDRTVDVEIDVAGITIDNLWDQLVAAPIGPIHFHRYASHDHSDYGSAALAFPIPFGPAYAATPTGFSVRMKAFPYTLGAGALQSTATLEEFVAALEGGQMVLNIHTDRFTNGEISGEVVTVAPVAAPTAHHG